MQVCPVHSLPIGRDIVVSLNSADMHLGSTHQFAFPKFIPPYETCFAGVKLTSIAVNVCAHRA